MPSKYEPQWPARYHLGCVTRLREYGVTLEGDDLELFQQVCDSIQSLSGRIRDEGPVIGGEPNPLIWEMRQIEQESFRVFRDELNLPVTARMWPDLSRLYELVADGVLNA